MNVSAHSASLEVVVLGLAEALGAGGGVPVFGCGADSADAWLLDCKPSFLHRRTVC